MKNIKEDIENLVPKMAPSPHALRKALVLIAEKLDSIENQLDFIHRAV